MDARVDAGRGLGAEFRGDESGVRFPTVRGGTGNLFLSNLSIDCCTLGEIALDGILRPEDPLSPEGHADPEAVDAWPTFARWPFNASFSARSRTISFSSSVT